MNPLFRPDEDVLGGLLAGMTPQQAGNLPAPGLSAVGGLLAGLARQAPGSLRRAWEGSDLRQNLQGALDTAAYYAGPHLSNRAAAVASAIPAVTPRFGTDDAAQAGEAFKAGNYGRGAGLMGLGVAGGLLDAIPGEPAVRGLLKGLTKAAHYAPDLGMAIAPIKAFHGSPHDFDRFDLSKIGTGEGAQAYGHGLYFAENKGVAKEYQKRLTNNFIATPQGPTDYGPTVASLAEHVKATSGVTDNQARSIAGNVLNGLMESGSLKRFERDFDMPGGQFGEAYQAALTKARESGYSPYKGRMYEVGIHADPERFLDWDRPLVEQPKAWEALHDAGFGLPKKPVTQDDLQVLRSKYGDWGEMQASGLEPLLTKTGGEFAPKSADVAAALADKGIPGIKYLDAGSRGAADGSRNYVTFSDDIVEILRKYGLAGLGVGLPAAMAMQPGLFPLPQQQ